MADAKRIFEDRLHTFYLKTHKYFKSRPAASYNVSEAAWENLTIECCLGVERDATDKIMGSDATYSQLEEQGAILPIEFNESESDAKTTRCYTMPFLFFLDLLEKPLKGLASPESSTTLIENFTPVIGNIVGSTKTEGLQKQGDYLEDACATSLWARYRLQSQAGEFVKLKDIVSGWPKDDHYVCFSGVGRLIQQLTANDLMKASQTSRLLKQAQCILINKQSARFTDVLVPVVQGEEAKNRITQIKEQLAKQPRKGKKSNALRVQIEAQLKDALVASTVFLLVQCRNMKADNSKIGPSHIAKELSSHAISSLLQEGHFYVLMAPNLPSSTLLERVTKKDAQTQLETHKDKLIETNGKGWLGELFLILNTTMKMENRPREATQKILNTKGTQKSKKVSGIEELIDSEEDASEKNSDSDADNEEVFEDEEEILVKKDTNNRKNSNNNNKKQSQTKSQKRKREQSESSEEKKRAKKKSKK